MLIQSKENMQTQYRKLPTVTQSKYIVDSSLDNKISKTELSPELKDQQYKILNAIKKSKLIDS